MFSVVFWGFRFPPILVERKTADRGAPGPRPCPRRGQPILGYIGPGPSVFWVAAAAPSVIDIAYENRKAGRAELMPAAGPAHGLRTGTGAGAG